MNTQTLIVKAFGLFACTMLAANSGRCDLQTGLAAWWRFDEGSGSTTSDSSGNGITLWFYSSPVWTDGVMGKALYFNGAAAHVSSDEKPTLASPAISVAGWFQLGSPAAAGYVSTLVFKSGNASIWLNGGGWILSIGPDRKPAFVIGNATSQTVANVQAQQPVALGTWAHIAATYDGLNVGLYVNGVLQGSGRLPGGYTPRTGWGGNLTIAAPNGAAGNYFTGKADEIRIYSRALSATEVQQLYKPSVSATLSAITVSPSSAPAGGGGITATVTLKDTLNNPVVGHNVEVYTAASGVEINGPSQPTDGNGQTTAQLSSSTAGTASIWAFDKTQPTIVQPSVTVEFKSGGLVLPNADLATAIASLYNVSASDLTGGYPSIAAYSKGFGADGVEFGTNVPTDAAKIVLDAALVGVTVASQVSSGQASAAEESSWVQLLKVAVAGTNPKIEKSLTVPAIGELVLSIIVSNPNGFSATAGNQVQVCTDFQRALQDAEQKLLSSGIPSLSGSQQTAWESDLQARDGVGETLSTMLQAEELLLADLRQARSQSSGNSLEFLAVKSIASMIATDFSLIAKATGDPAPLAGALIIDAGLFGVTEYDNIRNFTYDMDGLLYSLFGLKNSTALASEVFTNTARAFTELSRGQLAQPVSGQIGPMTDWVQGYRTSWPFHLRQGFTVTNAYSLLNLTNSSPQEGIFDVFVLSFYDATAYGVTIPNMPQISAFEASIPANSQAAVRVTYYDGQVGSVPNSSFGMVVYVLGSNGSDTFYIGSQARNWNPTELVNGTAGAKPMVPSQDIENPVATYITQIPSSQSYQASIFIRDPIDQGCSAIVTQALPAGIAILGTDGQVIGASIVWTNGISTNKLAKDSFSFSAPLVPGALMNLPPPSVVFVDETNNQSSAVLAVAFGFSGVFPVQASGSIPNGISGTDLSMPIVITNLTGINQSGSLTISLTNFTGVGVSSFSQSFSVGSFGTNILTFVLPGNIPPGQYRLTGTLSVSGGSGQVLAGIYTMPVAPLVLGLNPVSPLATSGLNLMLQGQVGSNALVMASSDLLNWTPIRYVSITNSPSYFNDTSATNYNERFYRAVMR